MAQEMLIKDISSGAPFVRWSRTICAILVEGIIRTILNLGDVEGIMGKINVKLFLIWKRCRLKINFTDDARRTTKTDHNSSPSAFGSGELKRH